MPCIQNKGVVPAVGANLEEFGVKFFLVAKSMGCILPCFGGSGGGLVNHLSFLPRCAFWWQPRLISVCFFYLLTSRLEEMYV